MRKWKIKFLENYNKSHSCIGKKRLKDSSTANVYLKLNLPSLLISFVLSAHLP